MMVSNDGPRRSTALPSAGARPGGLGRRRSRISAVPPGSTVTRYQADAFEPVCSGLTVAAPLTTWSLMPSLGHGVVGGWPKRRATLVSFSQNRSSGDVPSGAGPT